MARGISIIHSGRDGDTSLMIPAPEPLDPESMKAKIIRSRVEVAEIVLGDRHCLKRPFVKPGTPEADRDAVERNAHVDEAMRRIINSWSAA